MDGKSRRLDEILSDSAPLLVAYSGGVDSALLLARARALLGREAVTAAIADSPSLPRKALDDALALAGSLDARVVTLATAEMDNPDYSSNPPNRCYFCKAELFRRMDDFAADRGFAVLAYGENADDALTVRPGALAAREFHVLAPLRDAGLTKEEVRALSRRLALPTAEAPAQPCLSSRIPWGTPVTPEALERIERAEESVRAMGFRVFRVRHIAAEVGPPSALLQVAPDELPRLDSRRVAVVGAIRSAGFTSVAIDPDGYRAPVPAREASP